MRGRRCSGGIKLAIFSSLAKLRPENKRMLLNTQLRFNILFLHTAVDNLISVSKITAKVLHRYILIKERVEIRSTPSLFVYYSQSFKKLLLNCSVAFPKFCFRF